MDCRQTLVALLLAALLVIALLAVHMMFCAKETALFGYNDVGKLVSDASNNVGRVLANARPTGEAPPTRPTRPTATGGRPMSTRGRGRTPAVYY